MNEVILSILHRIIRGEQLDESAQEILDEWIAQSPHNKALYDEILNSDGFQEDIKKMLNYDSIAAWNKIRKGIPESDRPKVAPFYRKYAAAIVLAVLLGLSAGYFAFFKKSSADSSIARENNLIQPSDLKPGTDGAILRLADGRIIDLDNAANGTLLTEGNADIVKNGGALQYNESQQATGDANAMNTLRTPRSRKFTVTLSDGTKVWLNSGSSIQYPTIFSGNERRVTVTGEVYFEVAKNAAKPFNVEIQAGTVKKGEVEVLGTHFNVNAYDDEPFIQSTLLEGSVRITHGHETRLLQPGQQAKLNNKDELQVVNVDIEQVVAWKDNFFYFQDDNIYTVMRQVARWYGVEIVYKGGLIPQKYSAVIERNLPVKDLFIALQKTGGVQFEIIEQDDTTKIIVKPDVK
jgi:transmembrane sensor